MTRFRQPALVLFVCLLAVPPCGVQAQETDESGLAGSTAAPSTPESTEPQGQVVFVLQGRPAPFAGFLIEGEDLARWRFRIEALEYRLGADATAAEERQRVLVAAEQARTHAAEEILTLHEGLWTDRVTQLQQALMQAREAAERQWYESPALWLAVGLVLGVVGVTVAVVAR